MKCESRSPHYKTSLSSSRDFSLYITFTTNYIVWYSAFYTNLTIRSVHALQFLWGVWRPRDECALYTGKTDNWKATLASSGVVDELLLNTVVSAKTTKTEMTTLRNVRWQQKHFQARELGRDAMQRVWKNMLFKICCPQRRRPIRMCDDLNVSIWF